MILHQVNDYQILDEVKQNNVIYQWQADQLFAEAIKAEANNDLRDTDKSRCFAIGDVLSFDHQVCFSILYLFITAKTAEIVGYHIIVKDATTAAAKQLCTIVSRSRIICWQLIFASHVVCSRPIKR